ncbi:MAG: sigma-70 family RNA polymerase sigma factor [Chloroflexi bacterium]|nr:sigma-70 family RNA polymerase sigma factor [Chloroflexota bacterium]
MATSPPLDAAALYDCYAPALYRYIYYRLGAKTIAEDLTAEVFVRVLGMKHAPDDWRAYLYRIAHNLVVDYVRRNPAVFEGMDESLLDERGDPATRAELQDERRRVRRAIARLTPEQQQVVVLKFVEEMSNAQVARIMNKPEGAIKALQHRALTNLREWLSDAPDARVWKRLNESVSAA